MDPETDSANTRPTAAGVEPPNTQTAPMDTESKYNKCCTIMSIITVFLILGDICVYVQHASGTSNEAKREAMESVRRNLQTEWGGELWFVQVTTDAALQLILSLWKIPGPSRRYSHTLTHSRPVTAYNFWPVYAP